MTFGCGFATSAKSWPVPELRAPRCAPTRPATSSDFQVSYGRNRVTSDPVDRHQVRKIRSRNRPQQQPGASIRVTVGARIESAIAPPRHSLAGAEKTTARRLALVRSATR
jgi:hypothetical protein